MCIQVLISVFVIAELNKQVVILFMIYLVGSIAAFFRAWLYTLAGQRLVARLRKKVHYFHALDLVSL